MHTRKQKQKEPKQRKCKSQKVKNERNEMGGNYQVTSPSELFFVDLNGRIILIRSHCYEAEWLVRKENFLVSRGGEEGGKKTGRGVEGPRGGVTH